jgi:hypothetical protein
VWNVIVGVTDSDDVDDLPDAELPTATITFTPTPILNSNKGIVLVASATPPTTIVLRPINADLDSGAITKKVVSTDNVLENPTSWQYLVSFNLKDAEGNAISIASFPVDAPAGATVDLTNVFPLVITTDNTIITKGDPGLEFADYHVSHVQPTRVSVTPDTATRVVWINDTEPTTGGDYAIAGFDLWWKLT